MTRAAAVTAVDVREIQREVKMVAIELLAPSPFNPRKTFDEKQLSELADSIRAHDIQVPLAVRWKKRPWYVSNGLGQVRYLAIKNVVGHENKVETFSSGTPEENQREALAAALEKNGPELYEIVAGHRRCAAAKLVGLFSVPCIVREMTDDEAREIALIDNLQREDMPALEEADAYEALRQQLGTSEAIAARVGKPIEYIASRLKLVTLGELQREALALRLVTVDHALLLARLGTEEQDANLKWCLDVNAGIKTTLAEVIADVTKRRDNEGGRYGYWQPRTVLDLKAHIERHSGRQLAKAPWDLDDAKLVPAAGACSGCPSNTSHNTALFADLSIEDATCEDGKCFEAKRDQFVRICAIEADAIYRLSWKTSEAAPRMLKDGSGVNPHVVLRYGQWLDVKKGSCPDVVVGITVDWDDHSYSSRGAGSARKPGEKMTICVAQGCKAHPKAYEKKAAPSGPGNQNGQAAQEAREKKKPLMIAENKLRIAFVGKALEGITSIPAAALRFLLIERLPDPRYSDDEAKVLNALLPGIHTIAKTGQVASADFARAVALSSIDDAHLKFDNEGYGYPTDLRAELIMAVRGLCFSGPDPWSESS